jgi:hypothetical protein
MKHALLLGRSRLGWLGYRTIRSRRTGWCCLWHARNRDDSSVSRPDIMASGFHARPLAPVGVARHDVPWLVVQHAYYFFISLCAKGCRRWQCVPPMSVCNQMDEAGTAESPQRENIAQKDHIRCSAAGSVTKGVLWKKK